MSEPKSFFATLPGILTGLTGLVTAIAGLLYALNEIGVFAGPAATQEAVVEAGATAGGGAAPNAGTAVAGTLGAAGVTPPAQAEPAWNGTPSDGWAIIGFYERGRFSDLSIRIDGDSPAIGRRDRVTKDFRLVAERPQRGEAVITLGMVHRGDPVQVLDLDVAPGRNRVPVFVKLRAVVQPR